MGQPIPTKQLNIHWYEGPMLTPKETAFRLHVSPDTIYSWIRAGILPAFQPGGPGHSIQICQQDVFALLSNSPIRPLQATFICEPVNPEKSPPATQQQARRSNRTSRTSRASRKKS